jgi:hypothetical protein
MARPGIKLELDIDSYRSSLSDRNYSKDSHDALYSIRNNSAEKIQSARLFYQESIDKIQDILNKNLDSVYKKPLTVSNLYQEIIEKDSQIELLTNDLNEIKQERYDINRDYFKSISLELQDEIQRRFQSPPETQDFVKKIEKKAQKTLEKISGIQQLNDVFTEILGSDNQFLSQIKAGNYSNCLLLSIKLLSKVLEKYIIDTKLSQNASDDLYDQKKDFSQTLELGLDEDIQSLLDESNALADEIETQKKIINGVRIKVENSMEKSKMFLESFDNIEPSFSFKKT